MHCINYNVLVYWVGNAEIILQLYALGNFISLSHNKVMNVSFSNKIDHLEFVVGIVCYNNFVFISYCNEVVNNNNNKKYNNNNNELTK